MITLAGSPAYPLSAQRFFFVSSGGKTMQLPRTASSWDTSCRLAPVTINDSGAPRSSTRTWRLVPFFSPIRRIRTYCFLCHRGLDHRSVDALPLPCDPFHLVILGKPSAPKVKEKPRFHPTHEISMDRTGTSKYILRQCLPFTTCAKNIDNALKYPAIRNRLTTTTWLAFIRFSYVPIRLGD